VIFSKTGFVDIIPLCCKPSTWPDGFKEDMKIFGLSRKDGQVQKKWREKIKEATG